MENIDRVEQAAIQAEKPVTIPTLAKIVKLTPATVTKYLMVLDAKGRIKLRRIGNYLVVMDEG